MREEYNIKQLNPKRNPHVKNENQKAAKNTNTGKKDFSENMSDESKVTISGTD